MTPLLSPGKTWEGAAGAIVMACAASWLCLGVLTPWLTGHPAQTPLWGVIAYGAALALMGMIGDLAESLIKRDMGLKDSSAWLPGLGGVLDIIDSLLVAAPVAYLFWAAGIVG
jgi:phosphatidate cytidylyltransferase